ncbi:hypothetical protein A3K63_00625 [Candidatus Micrarchaeota archaeon RBG_16_49_10]|nr:MAG: hypothetical protein A3K63_00625 [Candidatus Micrarchaeota archaeon RBG_16_49_10]
MVIKIGKRNILVLGSGNKNYRKTFPKDKVTTLDIIKHPNVDIVHNLNKTPYPFKKGEFDLVVMDYILEHVNDKINCIKEIRRILKKTGLVKIRVPHYSSVNAFSDPEHKQFFATKTFYQLGSRYGFDVKKMKLNYISHPNNFFLKVINVIVNPFINLNFWFTERLICYYLGGISEIECEMAVSERAYSYEPEKSRWNLK